MRALLLLLAFSGSAAAGDLLIGGAVSRHSHGQYHEQHATIGWTHEFGQTWAAGIAATDGNSLGRPSVYGAVRWTPVSAGVVRAGAVLILATGYERGAVLVPAPTVVVDIGIAQPMLSLVPPVGGGPTIAILTLAWRWR